MGISNDLIGAEVIARHRRRRHRVAILNETVDEIDKHKNREMQGEEQISHTSNQCLNLWMYGPYEFGWIELLNLLLRWCAWLEVFYKISL